MKHYPYCKKILKTNECAFSRAEADPKTGRELWRFSAEFLKRLGRFESFTSRNVLFEVKKVLGECEVNKEKILEKVEAVEIVVDEVEDHQG